MKKRFNLLTAALITFSLALTGCSITDDSAQNATEYVNDDLLSEAAGELSEITDEATIIVKKNLFEPLLEEAGASASTSTVEAEKTDKSETDTDSEQNSDKEAKEDKVVMVFFGDSQFANGRDDGTDIPSLVSRRVPNSVSYNLGIGGTTASVEESTSRLSEEELTSDCFLGMVYALAGTSNRNETLANYPNVLETMNKIDPAEVDYYFIEYGANDFFNEVPLDATIWDKNFLHTYYGALSKGISKLQEISPDASIVLMSPFYGIYKDDDGTFIGDTYVVSNGIDTLANYARKALGLAEEKHLWSFDAMFISKCDLYLDTANEYLTDGVHLTLTGRQIFARLLAHIPNFKEGNEPYAYMDTDFIKIAEFDPDEYYRYDDGQMQMYYPESWEKYIKGEFPLAQPPKELLENSESGAESSSEESTEDSSALSST